MLLHKDNDRLVGHDVQRASLSPDPLCRQPRAIEGDRDRTSLADGEDERLLALLSHHGQVDAGGGLEARDVESVSECHRT